MSHLKTNYRTEFEELHGNKQVANKISMDHFVQLSPLTSIKKLPHNCTCVVELSNTMALFAVRNLRPLSIVDSSGFLNLMETAEFQYTVPC